MAWRRSYRIHKTVRFNDAGKSLGNSANAKICFSILRPISGSKLLPFGSDVMLDTIPQSMAGKPKRMKFLQQLFLKQIAFASCGLRVKPHHYHYWMFLSMKSMKKLTSQFGLTDLKWRMTRSVIFFPILQRLHTAFHCLFFWQLLHRLVSTTRWKSPVGFLAPKLGTISCSEEMTTF